MTIIKISGNACIIKRNIKNIVKLRFNIGVITFSPHQLSVIVNMPHELTLRPK
jgi:hypothetical protein